MCETVGEAEASAFNLFTLFEILIFQSCILLENFSSLLSVLVRASLNGRKWVFNDRFDCII